MFILIADPSVLLDFFPCVFNISALFVSIHVVFYIDCFTTPWSIFYFPIFIFCVLSLVPPLSSRCKSDLKSVDSSLPPIQFHIQILTGFGRRPLGFREPKSSIPPQLNLHIITTWLILYILLLFQKTSQKDKICK